MWFVEVEAVLVGNILVVDTCFGNLEHVKKRAVGIPLKTCDVRDG